MLEASLWTHSVVLNVNQNVIIIVDCDDLRLERIEFSATVTFNYFLMNRTHNIHHMEYTEQRLNVILV